MSARVLLVGCGELGSRHLQAIVSLPQVAHIEVVDPRGEALALGQQRVSETGDRRPGVTLRWLSRLEEASEAGQLCIVATQAQGRCQLVQDIARRLGYQRFLLEKLVGQSVEEFDALVEFADAARLAVWVNLKSRAYRIHQHIKGQLDPGEPVFLSVVGGNHGLANNGVHAADLFAFYDGDSQIASAGSHIDPILHRTKRGVFDLSGTLHAATEKGSRFTLSYTQAPADWELITIATRRSRWIVDHFQRWVMEGHAASGWAWRPVPCDENLLVSHMTKRFAADILAAGRCDLPTLKDAGVAHRYILGELRPHFSRLLEQEVELCPVT